MAKGDEEPLMSPAEMKPLLMLSKREPVSCAIGMTKDKTGIILLDKKAKPRKMLSLIKKKAAAASINIDIATCRFGHAMVDTAVDSALVQFVVNKDVPGTLRPKLIEQLKKAGFGKCEIRVDEGLEAEPEDTEDTGAADGAKTAAPPPASVTDSDTGAVDSAAPAAPAAPAASAPAGPAGPEAAAITQRLTALTRQMIAALGSNPAAADAMRTAATAGQAALKSGDLATATSSADALERMLGASTGSTTAPAGPAARNPPGSPVFTKARATWVATRSKVESELDKLHNQLQATYKGHGVIADLEKTFRTTVEPMMAQFDHTLSDKLDEVMKATDPAAHAALVAEAQQIITRYEGFLASNTLIGNLDQNPFVPLSIQKTLNASLTVLSKSIA